MNLRGNEYNATNQSGIVEFHHWIHVQRFMKENNVTQQNYYSTPSVCHIFICKLLALILMVRRRINELFEVIARK